jgi:hypothetical protein
LADIHDQKCPRKHTIAGLCDCGHFKCLNCNKTGHNCRDTHCPVQDLFRPHASRPKKSQGRGKDRDWAPVREPSQATPHPVEGNISDSDEDLYNPPPLPPNPTAHQIKTALHHRGIANLCRMSARSQVDENNASGSNSRFAYDTEEYPEAWNHSEPMDAEPARPAEYSPSHHQNNATNMNLA